MWSFGSFNLNVFFFLNENRYRGQSGQPVVGLPWGRGLQFQAGQTFLQQVFQHLPSWFCLFPLKTGFDIINSQVAIFLCQLQTTVWLHTELRWNRLNEVSSTNRNDDLYSQEIPAEGAREALPWLCAKRGLATGREKREDLLMKETWTTSFKTHT